MPLLEQARGGLGEVIRLLERRPARDRRDDVDAVGAARLDIPGEPELLEQLADQVRDLDRKREPVVGWVEIEEDEVGAVGLVDARVPRVHVDAVVLDHEEHCFDGVHEREVDEARAAFARVRTELARRDPWGQVLRRLLLEERFPVDAVRIALHRERSIAEMRDERRRNRAVVLEHVALGDPVVREEDPVGRRQLDVSYRH